MVEILDSTLREGEQTPGVSFTLDEKIELAKLLDKIGIEMIEAGDPMVSPKNEEAVKTIANLNLNAEIIAHIIANKKAIDKAKECNVDRVVILYPTSRIHLRDKIRIDPEKAIETMTEHIRYARKKGLKVRYTPEDATRTDFDYLLKSCKAAIKAGADRISIADTIGIATPENFFNLVKKIKQNIKNCKLDLHCHNDFGLALANSLAGIRAGADCIHVTVNGIGERAGIPDLAETIMSLKILENTNNKYNLRMLPEISAYVEKISGVFMAPIKPLTGENAFSHKSGVHTDGVLKNPKTYEAIDPESLGRERKIVIDKYTGKKAVANKLDEYGINYDQEQLKNIVLKIKEIGDERKIIHETDILEIAERVTGQKTSIIPRKINALVLVSVDSVHYTSSILRKLRNFKGVHSVFEITGDYDISVYVKVENVAQLNDVVEEFRTVPGIKSTSTKIVLKKFEGKYNGNNS
jgi:homocitrate synthase